jgi:hypothetical protein
MHIAFHAEDLSASSSFPTLVTSENYWSIAPKKMIAGQSHAEVVA